MEQVINERLEKLHQRKNLLTLDLDHARADENWHKVSEIAKDLLVTESDIKYTNDLIAFLESSNENRAVN